MQARYLAGLALLRAPIKGNHVTTFLHSSAVLGHLPAAMCSSLLSDLLERDLLSGFEMLENKSGGQSGGQPMKARQLLKVSNVQRMLCSDCDGSGKPLCSQRWSTSIDCAYVFPNMLCLEVCIQNHLKIGVLCAHRVSGRWCVLDDT